MQEIGCNARGCTLSRCTCSDISTLAPSRVPEVEVMPVVAVVVMVMVIDCGGGDDDGDGDDGDDGGDDGGDDDANDANDACMHASPMITPPFMMNFMFEVPLASMPAVDMCWLRSLAGIIISASDTL